MLKPKIENKLTINVPAGVIQAEAKMLDKRVIESSFINVPSYLYLEHQSIFIEGWGEIYFDVAFGGAFYAFVDADQLNISLLPSNHDALISLGKKIKKAVIKDYEIKHPSFPDLGFLYGTIFTGKPQNPSHHSRNVCIFADGELDRSATGSGVSARAGLHYSKGELRLNEKITIESILGSTMTVEVTEVVDYHGHEAIIPRVTGSACFVGKNEFWLDPADPYRHGFIFR
jgi:trans-L-3-hydroxyproline dehydratase